MTAEGTSEEYLTNCEKHRECSSLAVRLGLGFGRDREDGE